MLVAMTANELREKYLAFFVSKKHAVISGKSLIPENDPTVLFTTAGMHPPASVWSIFRNASAPATSRRWATPAT
jgi:alanyl-tRNA synthetase